VSQPRPAAPDPVQIAGRYDVAQRLGAGAFGTVYKAKDKLLGRMVAIKTIRLEGLAAQGASLEELLERFKREARVSAQLKHPNIVTVYDVGDSDGMTYLAMEFIDGMGLDRLIATEGRLPMERAALIAAQVADALDFAHKNGVVHRDIKPANIMIEPGDRVKVTDFGIAKATDSGEHLTVTGSLLGTPSYMSPEQAKGAVLDGRSDLFAVGCILYEMLVGKKAFRGESITGLIFKIITEEPPSLRDIDPLIPEPVIAIVQKALNKAPEARYQSGRELADDLTALTRPGSSPTMRQSEAPTSRGSSRSPAAPGAPTVVSTGPPAGSAPTVNAAPTVAAPPPAPRPAPPPPPASRPGGPASSAAPARPPAAPAPAVRPSGGGSSGLLIVGLGLFLLIGVGIAGIWYALSQRSAPAPGAPLSGQSTATGDAATAAPPAPTAATAAEPAATVTPAMPAPDAPSANPGPSNPPAATLPPTTARTAAPPAAEPLRTAKPPADAPVASARDDYAHLETEEAPLSGAEIGGYVADKYRSDRGGRSSGYGVGGLNKRPRSPRPQTQGEAGAIAVLRHVMNAEARHYKQNNRYVSLPDLYAADLLHVDQKPTGNSFTRKGYRFQLTVKGDEFEITATPTTPGPRPFTGSDSGFIVDDQ
jgi:eukaryotic-like serine/threonine-protein kinase